MLAYSNWSQGAEIIKRISTEQNKDSRGKRHFEKLMFYDQLEEEQGGKWEYSIAEAKGK